MQINAINKPNRKQTNIILDYHSTNISCVQLFFESRGKTNIIPCAREENSHIPRVLLLLCANMKMMECIFVKCCFEYIYSGTKNTRLKAIYLYCRRIIYAIL